MHEFRVVREVSRVSSMKNKFSIMLDSRILHILILMIKINIFLLIIAIIFHKLKNEEVNTKTDYRFALEIRTEVRTRD